MDLGLLPGGRNSIHVKALTHVTGRRYCSETVIVTLLTFGGE